MNPTGISYVGADVHERESQIAILEPGGKLLYETRIETKDLPSFINSLRGEKHVAIESIGFIYPIFDKLKALPMCHVHVANPNRLLMIAKSKTKCDRVDAKILGDALRGRYLPTSWIPEDDETREKRLIVRDRVRYGVRKSNVKISIRWLLKRKGIEVKSPFSHAGREQLRSLGLFEIESRLEELSLVESMIKKLDGMIIKLVSEDKKAKLLDTLPGLAPYTSLFLSSHVGDINRFPDSRHMCADLGLVPMVHQTGDTKVLGHITKTGNKWLRRNLIECARAAVKKDKNLRKFYLKLRRKRGEKKALTAVARKLISYAYWILKRNLTYEELNPWSRS
jgi:transposase